MENSKDKFLADCRPDWAFWVCNGNIIKNIYELARTVHGLNKDVFFYHVNKDKNDFSKWVGDVLEDGVLAKTLEKEHDKKKFEKKILARIKQLESLKIRA